MAFLKRGAPSAGGKSMALTRGSFRGYEYDRMVVLFSMIDGLKEISCAISTSAMDDLESPERSKPDQREAQFMSLRDRTEERAARKFLAMGYEGPPPAVRRRSFEFRNNAFRKGTYVVHVH